MGRDRHLILFIVALMLVVPLVAAHSAPGGEAFVRVIAADPATKTYTFACEASPSNSELRDFFVRPDDGEFSESLPNEAESLDRAAGDLFTYTFQQDKYYHIGCIIVNSSNSTQQTRGDLHLDLRNTSWDPNVVVLNGSGKTATLRCDHSGDATYTWEVVDARTGAYTDLGPGQTKSFTAPAHGLYDFICHAQTSAGQTHNVPFPVEFFDQGDPYFADKAGVPQGVTTQWVRTTNYTASPMNSTPSNTTQQPNGACYTSVRNIPADCAGGTLTTDTWNGCRQLVCTGAGSSMSVLACDKAGFFEMYKQGQTGIAISKICIGSTCISDNGFARSANYPICIGNTTVTPPNSTNTTNTTTPPNTTPPPNTTNTTNTTQPPNATNSTLPNATNGTNTTQPPNSTNASVCYTAMKSIPSTCNGGSITQDYIASNSCRNVVCQNGTNALQIKACDKGAFFEMYPQTVSGTPPQICIGGACIRNEGYVKSANYPICIGNTTVTPPNSTNTTNTTTPPNTTPPQNTSNSTNTTQPPNSTNSTNGTNTSQPPSACYSSLQSMPISCTGGTFTQDTYDGCRHLTCTGAGSSMSVLACEKPSSSSVEYFEMYKQGQTGTGVTRICIAGTCISDGGFARSGHYPICVGNTTVPPNSTNTTAPPNTSNPTNTTNSTASPFVWIEPTQGQLNTATNAFHLNVQVPAQDPIIPWAQWEIWNAAGTERVWHANNTGQLRFHTHTPDGAFEGSRAGTGQLAYSTQYQVRTRWGFANGSMSPWSDWRIFTTSAQQTGGNLTWTAASGFRVERFATGFDAPVHVAFAPRGMYDALPDSVEPYIYVTELYGKVKVVHKDGSQAVYADNLLNFEPFGSITGGGQMGVIGLYVDNTTGDLFVGMTYVENNDTVKNKVMRFNSTDDGNSFVASRVLIDNLPSAPSHQVEQITKGPDGKIYINLGDALNEQNAQLDGVLAGKIIRMNPDGTNVEVYAKGLRNPFGADWRPGTGQLYATDNSPNTNDRLLRINQGGNYLWGTGTNDYVSQAIDLLNPSPVDVEFNPGNSGFPSGLDGRMYVAVGGPIYQQGPTNGKQIIEYTLDTAGNIIGKREFVVYTGTGYGTPIGLDFGPDGLYFTDIYGEPGFVGLGETEGNIYRIVPGSPDNTTQTPGPFRAGIQVAKWYPKDTGSGIEYIFACQGIDGSGAYKYDWSFGNGQGGNDWSAATVGPYTYPYGDVDYNISCVVKDQTTGKSASASMTINPSDYLPGGTEP